MLNPLLYAVGYKAHGYTLIWTVKAPRPESVPDVIVMVLVKVWMVVAVLAAALITISVFDSVKEAGSLLPAAVW